MVIGGGTEDHFILVKSWGIDRVHILSEIDNDKLKLFFRRLFMHIESISNSVNALM